MMLRATRDGTDNLIVTNSERFVQTLLAACVAGPLVAWCALPARPALGWTVVSVVFGLALSAANERSEFVFDRRNAVVRWRKTTALRRESGRIPFSSITALSLERDFRFPPNRRGGARRLVIQTEGDMIPVTTAFHGTGGTSRDVGIQIQKYLLEVGSGRAIAFQDS
jgi:hypothetical protein